eukprot:SAG31_NODE_2776_length_5105_cov_2.652817_7_plen_37_part_00
MRHFVSANLVILFFLSELDDSIQSYGEKWLKREARA